MPCFGYPMCQLSKKVAPLFAAEMCPVRAFENICTGKQQKNSCRGYPKHFTARWEQNECRNILSTADT